MSRTYLDRLGLDQRKWQDCLKKMDARVAARMATNKAARMAAETMRRFNRRRSPLLRRLAWSEKWLREQLRNVLFVYMKTNNLRNEMHMFKGRQMRFLRLTGSVKNVKKREARRARRALNGIVNSTRACNSRIVY
jgi:hypothetical protein